LDEAISLFREAVSDTPESHPDLPMFLSGLAYAALARFKRTGELADAGEAVDAGRRAVQSIPAGHPMRPQYLLCLGTALVHRSHRTEGEADLDEAIGIFREAASDTPVDHPDQPMYLTNLGNALLMRFSRTGELADAAEAVDAGRRAMHGVPAGHGDRPLYLTNLANALLAQSQRTGKAADLDDAITVSRQAADDTPPDHPFRPDYLLSLGNALYERFRRVGNKSDLAEAVRAMREGASIATAVPGVRFRCAWQYAELAVRAGDLHQGLAAYEQAVRLLPSAAWVGLSQDARGHRLAGATGFGSYAAACAIAAGDLARAVEFLEASRSVLWAQTLSLRADLTRLEQADPALASDLRRARAILDQPMPGQAGATPPPDSSPIISGISSPESEQAKLETRRRAARDLEQTLIRIRRIHGFEQFLAPARSAACARRPRVAQ
jgi:tetratricopeptide (TPR) repeat protein